MGQSGVPTKWRMETGGLLDCNELENSGTVEAKSGNPKRRYG